MMSSMFIVVIVFVALVLLVKTVSAFIKLLCIVSLLTLGAFVLFYATKGG
jgi:hypothetical protein